MLNASETCWHLLAPHTTNKGSQCMSLRCKQTESRTEHVKQQHQHGKCQTAVVKALNAPTHQAGAISILPTPLRTTV